jgi:hypothetical protein
VLEIDGERRRLSLSLKRVEEGEQPVPRADGGESVHTTPDLKLTEEAFPTESAAAVAEEFVKEVEAGEPVTETEAEVEIESEPEAGTTSGEAEAEEPTAETESAEVSGEADAEDAPAEDAPQPDETEPAA